MSCPLPSNASTKHPLRGMRLTPVSLTIKADKSYQFGFTEFDHRRDRPNLAPSADLVYQTPVELQYF
jgi:hypothetical protein